MSFVIIGMNGLMCRTRHYVVNKSNQNLPFPLWFPKTTRSQENERQSNKAWWFSCRIIARQINTQLDLETKTSHKIERTTSEKAWSSGKTRLFQIKSVGSNNSIFSKKNYWYYFLPPKCKSNVNSSLVLERWFINLLRNNKLDLIITMHRYF